MSIAMDFSIFPDFMSIHKSGTIESLNSLPYLAMWFTGTAWIIYSICLNDLYIFSASLPGATVSIFYIITCCSNSEKGDRLKLCVTWMLSFAIVAAIGMTSVALNLERSEVSDVWGWVANVTLVFFYASPLSTALHVIASLDSSSLNHRLAFAETIYGALWTIYGLATRDLHVWAPNAFGAGFGAVQLLLLLLLPRRPAVDCGAAAAAAEAEELLRELRAEREQLEAERADAVLSGDGSYPLR